MKANTPELMKFKRLQRRLNVSVAELAGHLELLWIATAKNAPEGDIGRFSNEDIAIACYWEKDPELFVSALVECGWLDTSKEWRLLVHDWPQHAPNYVHGGLKRHGRKFCAHVEEVPKDAPKDAPKEVAKQSPIGATPEDAPTKPSQVKPSQVNTLSLSCDDESIEPKAVTEPILINSLSFAMERAGFKSEAFREIYEKWRKYSLSKGKFIDQFSEEMQVMTLSKDSLSEQDAIEMIEYTMFRNVVGLITNGEHRKENQKQAMQSAPQSRFTKPKATFSTIADKV